jgi:TetR/AcrR family transcriptional repressor of multidrug resistance operon
MQVLASKGFHGFFIKQVADHAGVAAGTVYLYFADREDLIAQLYRWITEKFAHIVFAQHDPAQSFEAQYRQLCAGFWKTFAQEPAFLLCKIQFDHLPADLLLVECTESHVHFQPLFSFFALGRKTGAIKNLPDEVLFSIGFEFHFALARKQMQGLVDVDDALLEQTINAGWDALRQTGKPC